MMQRQQVLNCNFSAWYPKFKNITIRSRIIPLPKEFVDYLKADNVYLPGEPIDRTSNISDDESEEWDDLDVDITGAQSTVSPEFRDLETRLKEAMVDLDGIVFPKLNWSSPIDASWISCDGTLKCSCPHDIYLLLKSSDYVARTIFDTFRHCEDGEGQLQDESFELVLREWRDINPAMEFRCFVRNNELIAISQRDIASCYDFIGQNERSICNDIMALFTRRIANKFPDVSYTFDVYRWSSQKVLLIDFNPFGYQTDPLLFSWDELHDFSLFVTNEDEGAGFHGVFKYITSTAGVQPSPRHMHRIPSDIMDLTQGTDVNKLVDLLTIQSLIKHPGEESDSD